MKEGVSAPGLFGYLVFYLWRVLREIFDDTGNGLPLRPLLIHEIDTVQPFFKHLQACGICPGIDQLVVKRLHMRMPADHPRRLDDILDQGIDLLPGINRVVLQFGNNLLVSLQFFDEFCLGDSAFCGPEFFTLPETGITWDLVPLFFFEGYPLFLEPAVKRRADMRRHPG